MDNEGAQVDGVTLVGEVVTRTLREAITEPDFHNAWVAGANWALQQASARVLELVAMAGPYDDTRALGDLETWITDKIREVHTTNGTGCAERQS